MNLIICYTPLQVVVAEKIISLYPQEKFYGVMIHAVNNKKFDFYADRLKKKCSLFSSFEQHITRYDLLKDIIILKHQFKNFKFDKVFAASINDIKVQFLLSSINFDEFYSFDDGTANITKSSFYYVDNSKPIRKLANFILGNKYNTNKLKSISKAHYTIYPHFPNIIQNTIFIDLFKSATQNSASSEQVVNILLGQPVYLDNQQNIDLAERVIKQFNIDYYLPHPREQYKLENVKYIDTPLIFEDYMAQHFSNQKCRVYTYFSSAVLNIHNQNIEPIALRIDTDNPAFIECYDLLAKSQVKIIDIRE